MLRKIWLLAVVLATLLLAVLLINTFRSKPWPVHHASSQLPLPDSAVEHLCQAVRFPTISPADTTEIDSAAFIGFRSFLEKAYPLVHASMRRTIIKNYSYIFEWPGSDSSLHPIIFMGHYDVVPVEPSAEKLWHLPPFGGVLKDSMVWGRGAVDDKVAVISMLEAAEQLLKHGFKPVRTILLCFGHNEESTGTGAMAIVDHLRQRNIRADLVMDEGGEITTGKISDVQRPVAMIGVGEKGYVTFELAVQKPGGHSSKPARETAIDILAAALFRLRSVQMPMEMTPPLNEFLTRISGSSGSFINRLALNNRWMFGRLLQNKLAALPESEAMERTTIVPTMLQSGIRENVIPTNATAIVNCRILTGQTTAQVMQFISEAIHDNRVSISIKGDFNTEPSSLTNTASPAFKRIEQAVYAAMDSVIPVPYVMLGASDSRVYRPISDGVINFTPLVNSKGFHGIDERLPVADLQRAVNFFTGIMKDNANPF